MSQPMESAGELVTNRQGEPVKIFDASVQCYFHPETEQLVFLTGKNATEFENHSSEMREYASGFHSAQKTYESLLERYAKAFEQSGERFPGEAELRKEVSTAEEALEAKRDELRKAMGDFSHKNMGYDGVTELLPVARGKNKRPFAYVKRGYLDKAGAHRVKPTGRDKTQGRGSIYITDANGRSRIDADKLKKQMTHLDVRKISLELKDVLKWVGAEDVLKDLQKDESLFDWADEWNEKLLGSRELTDNIDVAGGAQVMRYVQNVGAKAEFDPDKGTLAIKGEARSSVTLVSGMCEFSTYVPDRVGWSLAFTTRKGNLFDLGMMRLLIKPTVSGFVGATAVLEGQLQVVTKGEQQLLAGQPGSRLPRFKERRDKGVVFHRQREAEDEGLDLSAEVFAGAKVEGELKGSLQWLKPADPPEMDAGLTQPAKASGTYIDLCTLAPSIGALAGIGAGGKFHCEFIDGKFCFHVAASLCWGTGAKGGLVFEVGTTAIMEFGAWLAYQLYKLDYGFLDVISEDAFGTYTKCCVLRVGDAENDLYKILVSRSSDFREVTKVFNEFMEELLGDSPSQKRNKLSWNVISNHQGLLQYTPEAKGILLYLLTRHGIWDDLDLDNYGVDLMPDRFQQRKEAVVLVLRSIQTRREWQKVLSRVSRDGTSLVKDSDVHAVVRRKEQELIEFLQLGFNRDEDLLRERARVEEVFESLKGISWGYALAMNDSIYYRLNTGANPSYPESRSYGPSGERLV